MYYFVVVNDTCTTARRAEALGYHYEARLRGLDACDIYLTPTLYVVFSPYGAKILHKNVKYHAAADYIDIE
jgi:hypothetical protein